MRCSLGAVLLHLTAVDASATAIAMADIRLDWGSLTISAPNLSVLPDPVGSGAYANTAFLSVQQAGHRDVTVDSADLAPYNLSLEPINVSRSVVYNAGDSIGNVAANLATGPSPCQCRCRSPTRPTTWCCCR